MGIETRAKERARLRHTGLFLIAKNRKKAKEREEKAKLFFKYKVYRKIKKLIEGWEMTIGSKFTLSSE
jgi:hypothetical protein